MPAAPDTLFKCHADPTRAIFGRLCQDGEQARGDAQGRRERLTADVSKHSSVLKLAGSVRERREGARHSLQHQGLAPLID